MFPGAARLRSSWTTSRRYRGRTRWSFCTWPVKTVILDENIPRKLKKLLSGHRVATVPEMGWGGVKNGRLITLIDGTYEVFITADKNLRYQQNLRHRNLSIIEVPFNDAVRLLPIASQILAAIEKSTPGSYEQIQEPIAGA